MTVLQIQYFLEVAKEESFSKAAQNLYISHQALSNHLKALEKELGLTLLDRSNKRRVMLTDAGRIMYDAWSEMQSIADQALLRARKMQALESRSLVIGIQDMKFVRSYVVPLIRKLQGEESGISLEYRLGTPREMLAMLDSGDVDMLIMISSDIADKTKYQTAVLQEDALHLVIAMSKHYPLAEQKLVTLGDLEGETILMIDSSYSGEAAQRFQKDLRIYDFRPGIIKTFNSPRAINIAVETGLGVALLFDELLEEARDEIKTYPAVLPHAEGIDMLLVWKEKKLDPMAEQIVRFK